MKKSTIGRRFNSSQKVTLYLYAKGVCSICSKPLSKGWHGDHIHPYSKGGQTDIVNGQALCAECNLKKGSSMQFSTWNTPLRAWQQDACNAYLDKNLDNFLLVASPGAGKTIVALRIAHHLLSTGRVNRIVVVCPTDHLRRQWADKATEVGIHLDPTWEASNGREISDYCGIVITYAAVAVNSDMQRKLCYDSKTFVIMDEIHHAGDECTWGKSLLNAYGLAKPRLLLSGTPFRNEGDRIPFVTYDDNDRSVSSFSYNYGKALDDNVCRFILFPHYEGRMKWTYNGISKTASFSDKLSQEDAARRRRTALAIESDWLPTILQEADEKLTEVREEGHPKAGGIIVAVDQEHAEDLAKLLTKITGRKPVVAISKDSEASDKIKQFSKSEDRWIVAVRMVSEGVDIPRLRVGVYATNIITELFFRQFVGRLLRVIGGIINDDTAHLFIYADDQLIQFAQQIKEERDHQLKPVEEPTNPGLGGSPGLFVPIDADSADFRGTISGSDIITPEELQKANQLVNEIGLKGINDNDKIKLLVWSRNKVAPVVQERSLPVTKASPVKSVHEARNYLIKKRTRLVKVLGARIGDFLSSKKDRQEVFPKINGMLIKIIGVPSGKSTIEQQKFSIEILNRWLDGLNTAINKGTAKTWIADWQRTRGSN